MAQPAYSKGSRVWVQHEGVWRPATVVAATAAKATLRLDSQQGEGAGPELVVATAELEPCNPALLDGVRCAAFA